MSPKTTSGSTSTGTAQFAESPYGTRIAHGFVTLSLIPGISKGNYVVQNAKMGINYGLNNCRRVAYVA
jgi:acyl dehydratase